ncbi:hypothetical protein Tco_1214851 [Tanacetum coccineum]
MKSKHSIDDYLYCADHTTKLVQEQWVDTVNHDGEWTEEGYGSNKVLAISFYPRTELVEPLEWKDLKNRLKPSSMKPPKLELKELPKHLELLRSDVKVRIKTVTKASKLQQPGTDGFMIIAAMVTDKINMIRYGVL